MESSRLPSSSPWVVIPTYNEAGNIVPMVAAVLDAVPGAHVIVVDDSSPDGTGDLVAGVAAEDPRVSLLVRAQKSGLGAAYRDGFREALERGASAVVEVDADFSHDPVVIPELLLALDAGAGLAIGSRYVAGGASPGLSSARLAISRGGNAYARFTLGLPVHDATAGFRAYRSEVLASIPLAEVRADGYGFQVEMAYRVHRLGLPIAEVPIVFRNRRAGSSKMSKRIVVEAMLLCTVWGVARRFPTLFHGERQERALEMVATVLGRLERLRSGGGS